MTATLTPKKKRISKNLFHTLQKALNEKDVENAWRGEIAKRFPSCVSSPSKTDGILWSENLTALLEFKNDFNFKDKSVLAGVIIQAIFYLKEREKKGQPLPKSIFLGDSNECAVLPTSAIIKYLLKNWDWSIPASQACQKLFVGVNEIANDKEIKPFIYEVNENFRIDEPIEKMKGIEKGEDVSIAITGENIVEIFSYFRKNVITDKKFRLDQIFDEDNKARLSRLCDLFFNCLTDPDETYLSPKKKNTLVCKHQNYGVNENLFDSFFSHFRKDYTPQELEELVANKDRIIEDTKRRREGAFFTPTLWVNEAHSMISATLGQDWKEKYVVWDCCSGTNNLTRDYKFKELYCSTLEEGDITTVGDMKYNPGSTVFQYDFLSEIGIDNVPEKLRKVFEEKKEVVFFINPPYGTASNLSTETNNHKADIAKNPVNTEMLKDKLGFACRNLYCQFIYKIIKLKEKYGNKVKICLFAPPIFLSSDSNSDLKDVLINHLSFREGMIFQASNFADVADQWGISFSVFE